MAALVGHVSATVGDTSDVHTALQNPLGTRAQDAVGNEYIYLTGVASTAIGTWVTFDELHITTRAVANGKGRVAIAMAATVASTYGWYQIYGKASGLALTGSVDNSTVWFTSTNGSVDDADVAVDLVFGAIARSAVNETTLLQTFELSYPIAHNSVIN